MGQKMPLVVYETKIDASLPFYEVEKIAYYQEGGWKPVEKRTYLSDKGLLLLNSGAMFSVTDGLILEEGRDNRSLLQDFNVSIYQTHLPTKYKYANLKVFVQEKDWENEKKNLHTLLERELQEQFPAYKTRVDMEQKQKKGKTLLEITVISDTGGDEFETTQAQKVRVATMKTAIEPFLLDLVRQNHIYRLRDIQRNILQPYRDTIREKRNPRKLHTVSMDIQSLGNYSADKEIFYDVVCDAGQEVKRLTVPVVQAKVLRASPQEYQIKAYVFRGNMSQPWCPNQNLKAFGFYEIVHKQTQSLLVRTQAYFKYPYGQKYHSYGMKFPSF